MRIRVAQNIGFCFGVKRAMEMVEGLLRREERIYILGELIHNKEVTDYLTEKGAVTVNSPMEVPAGECLVIRSHGVPPDVHAACAERELRVADATCPFVQRIHDIVRGQWRQGKTILLVGEAAHPECIGINGCCGNQARFISDPDQLNALPAEEPVCLVAQTTSSEAMFERIEGAVSARFENASIFNTICSTTRQRQKEAEALSKTCSRMLVIGSKNSSNTQKLIEVCGKYCKHVDSLAKLNELSLEKIHTDDIIGIVSGASAPDWKIREVITRMSELEKTMAGNPVENDGVETGAQAAVEEPIVTECAEAPVAQCEVCADQPAEEPKAEPAAEADATAADKADNADQSFAEAFEKTLVRIRNGQIITGSVVQIVDGEVCVNIGYKSDGFIPRNEFSTDPDANPVDILKIGDPIEVEVIKVNDGEGNVLLSRKNVESKKMWDTLMQDEEITDKVFEGVGKEVVKGGLIAAIDGVRAFIPASQLSTKYVENIAEYVGQPISLKVIEVDKARKRIVASHKAVMLAEAEEARKQKWAELEVGSKVNGVVRRLTDFGAFVDIGGIDGLVHVTDVAWGRVKHPKDVLSIGQEIEVIIRDVDVERQRVSLGYKQLQPKPWTMADQKYPVGSIVEGKVVRIVPFGAFVALEPTIDGLIHISQVGVKRIVKVEDEINVGDVVRCKVLDVNTEAKRISLSRREAILDENPEIAEELAQEKAERERMAAERAEQRAASDAQRQQHQQQERPERPERNDRPERRERSDRPRRENADYDLPPVQQSTTSLAGLFAAAMAGSAEEKKDEE